MRSADKYGIKIGTHIGADASDEELVYLQQLGVRHVRIHVPEITDDPTPRLRKIRDRFAGHDIQILSAVYLPYQSRKIAFALNGRDAVIENLCQFIIAMGTVGIGMLDYDFFLYAPLPQTGETTTRGVKTREFCLDAALKMPSLIKEKSKEENIWENHRYLMEKVIPIAEKAGVKLALHPDDPPVPELQGIPRIFRNIDVYRRAMDAFNSPAWGVLFCVGTWAEGGNAMGMDTCEAIRLFSQHGKLFSVHFRNVSAPLPVFHETFLDNGYVNMTDVMQTLVDCNFDGLVIPDHFPAFDGDSGDRESLAFAIGYMRGLRDLAVRNNSALKGNL